MIQFIAALVMGLNAIRIGCDFPMWMQVRIGVTFVHIIPILLQFFFQKNKCRDGLPHHYYYLNHRPTVLVHCLHGLLPRALLRLLLQGEIIQKVESQYSVSELPNCPFQ